MELEPGKSYQFYRGTGCSECFMTGYRGRVGAFEILKFTPKIRRAVHARDQKELERAVEESDFIPIRENCIELVEEGITTVDEVVRTLGKL